MSPAQRGIRQYRYFNLLAVLSVTCMLVAMLLPYKIVQIGSFTFPGGVLIFPSSYIFSDVIAEVYGYKMARQLIWITIAAMCLFSTAIYFSIHLPSPPTWHLQHEYNVVLGSSLRAFVGFTVGLLISDFINVYAISKWKIMIKGRYFWLRSMGSTAIGEAAFSVVAGLILYTGKISFSTYLHLTASIWFFKVLYNGVAVYPAFLLAAFLKRREGVDVYDYHTNFNPLRFFDTQEALQLQDLEAQENTA